MSPLVATHDVLRLDPVRATELQLTLHEAAVGLRNDGLVLDRLLHEAARLLGGDPGRPVVAVRTAADELDALSADLHRRLTVVDEMTARAAEVDALTVALAAFRGPPSDAARAEMQRRRFALVRQLLGGDEALARRVIGALGTSADLAAATRRVAAEVARETRIDEAMVALALPVDEATALIDRLDASVTRLVGEGYRAADAAVAVAIAEEHGLDIGTVTARARERGIGLLDAVGDAVLARGIGVSLADYDALSGFAAHFEVFDAARTRRNDERVTVADLEFVVAEPCFFTEAQVAAASAILVSPTLLERLDTAHENDDIFGDRADASPAGFGRTGPGDGLVSAADLRAFMLKSQLHVLLRDHRDAIDIADDPTAIVDGYRSEADFRAFLDANPELPEPVRAAAQVMLDAGWFDESWWQRHKDEVALGAALVAGGVVVVVSGGSASWVVVGGVGALAAGGTTVAINLGTDDELLDDVFANAGKGFLVGTGVSGFATGLARYGSATGALTRLHGVAAATAGGSDVVMAGGVDILLAEDREESVKDWVEPVNRVANATEIGFGVIRERLPDGAVALADE